MSRADLARGQDSAAGARSRRQPLAIALVVLIASMAALANNYQGRFYFDDNHHIVENPALRSLADIPRLFTDPTTFSAWGSPGYRPVVLATHALNFQLSGHEVWSYHLVNNLIHALNALLLLVILQRLLARPPVGPVLARAGVTPPLLALPLALLFALHPIQGEAINYINARSDLLATTFYLGAVLLFLRWRRAGEDEGDPGSRPGWAAFGMPAAIVLLGLLSAASKEIGLTLVANLLVIDWVVLGNTGWRRLRRGLVIHLPVALSAVGYWYATRALIGRHAVEYTQSVAPERSLAVNLLTQPAVVVGYLRSIVLPTDLSFMRYPANVEGAGDLRFLFSVAVLLLLLGLALWLVRRVPLVTAGLAWFALVLAPTSSFFVLHLVAAERRCYLPMVGVVLVAAGLLAEALRAGLSKDPRWRFAPVALSLAILLAYAPATWVRNGLWKDAVRLFEDVVEKSPDNPRAWIVYAEELRVKRRYAEAEAALARSMKLDPGAPPVHLGLGRVYLETGRLDEAEAEMRRSLTIADRVFLERGIAERDLARVFVKQGRLAEAERIFDLFLGRYPRDWVSLAGLARIAAMRGDDDLAIEYYRRANTHEPEALEPRVELALALHRTGNLEEAGRRYRLLLDELPGNTELLYNLALVRTHEGDVQGAIAGFRAVLEQQPENFQALVHLAELLEGAGSPVEALEAYLRARALCTDETRCSEIQRRMDRLR